jgi:hypothetical protein
MLNFRASDSLHELVDRAVEVAGVDKSAWLRVVIREAARREVDTHRFVPLPVVERGVERNGHRFAG